MSEMDFIRENWKIGEVRRNLKMNERYERDDNDDRLQQEQSHDYHRAECELNLILMKLKSGEYKMEDIFRLEGLLKFMGVNINGT